MYTNLVVKIGLSSNMTNAFDSKSEPEQSMGDGGFGLKHFPGRVYGCGEEPLPLAILKLYPKK